MRIFRVSSLFGASITRDGSLMQRYTRNPLRFEAIPTLLKHKRTFFTSKALTNVSCSYRNGYVVLTLPLPSRNEQCEFTLRPVSHTVKDLVSFVQDEDGGVDRFALYSMSGNKISNSTPINILMESDYKVELNDKVYDVVPPKTDPLVPGALDQLSTTKNLISQLYTDIGVQQYKEQREDAILKQIEALKNELEPLEQQKSVIDASTAQKTNFLVWAGLGYMALQFGFLARLTWWEYSWDIMEPVTYFVTYATSMAVYAYFVLTREDCNYPDMRNRTHLLSFYKSSKVQNFDVSRYNTKKETVAILEKELALLKSPPLFADFTKPVES